MEIGRAGQAHDRPSYRYSRRRTESQGVGAVLKPLSPSGREGLGSEGLLRRLELHRHAVHAVAQAGGRRAVGEDVAEVAAAAGAVDLGAGLEEAAVDRGAD